MRDYKLDDTLLPKVWLTWASTKNGSFNKRYWLNCQTGVKKDKPESWMKYSVEPPRKSWKEDSYGAFGLTYYTQKNDKIWVNSGTDLKYAYLKYHKDIDRFEIAVVSMDTSRKAEPHKWEYLGNRYFIGKDKSILDAAGNLVNGRMNLYSWHTAENGKCLLGHLIRLNHNDNLFNEFKKFLGSDSFVNGHGVSFTVDVPWKIQKWYEYSQKVRKPGKQQKLTDDLTSIPLNNIDNLSEKYPPIKMQRYDTFSRDITDFLYFERIDDEWSVLRAFNRSGENMSEPWRMYISDNGVNRIVSKSSNGWVPSKQIHSRWAGCFIANEEEAKEKCKRIKYILESIDTIQQYSKGDFLVTTLRFPELEQFIKLGYPTIATSILRNNQPKAYLKDLFGGYYNDKEKNALRKIGFTKNQLDYYMDKSAYGKNSALAAMRNMFGNDLTYMDEQSFEKYLDMHCTIRQTFWLGYSRTISMIGVDSERFFKTITRLQEKRLNACQLIHDTINAYRSLDIANRPEINWYFDDYSDLIRAHDSLDELRRIQESERRALWDKKEAERLKKEEENRKKLDEKRKEYEYEDDDYIIRLPKDLHEILREGSVQHICIGGYTSRHAMGQTNLFFLRKKDEPDVPFYAIEMNNDKDIVQIHGFGNKWLGNNPDAIPTVVRWLRKNGIKCSNQKLTCTATGYCSTNRYVPMPVVD